MTFNTPAILHKWIVRNQETYMKVLNDLRKRYKSVVVLILRLVKIHDPNYLTWYLNYQNLWTKQTCVTTSIFYAKPSTQLILQSTDTRLNQTETSMYHGNYVAIETRTIQEIMKPGKER